MIEKPGRELSNNKRQRFRMNTHNRMLEDLQKELESKGVKGYVVAASPTRVTLLAHQDDLASNRRIWNDQL